MKTLLKLGLGFVLLVWLVSQCDHTEKKSGSGSSSSNTATSTPPRDYESMPGNGTFEMGGAGGKNWGVYTATVPADSSGCQWSIRSVARYRPGLVLDEGAGTPGGTVRVDIAPDGDVGMLDGMIGDHRLVFMTSGCGPWTMVK